MNKWRWEWVDYRNFGGDHDIPALEFNGELIDSEETWDMIVAMLNEKGIVPEGEEQ